MTTLPFTQVDAFSERPFAGHDARLSRYSYLVSLFPRRIADDLGIKRFELLGHIHGQQELVVADENSKVAASRLCQNMNPLAATLLPGENPPYHIG